jgi:hypothetical protein
MGRTRATDTEKRHSILEKGRFLLANYCEIGTDLKIQRNIIKGRIIKRPNISELINEKYD